MATPEVLAEKRELAGINADYKEKFGFHDSESGYAYKAPKGLSREVVETISDFKEEPKWMRDFRLKALEHFESRPTPKWGGDLDQIDFDDIHYFVRASEKNSRDWSEVPEDIKNTFDRLGIPEAERKFLAGVGAQYESEVVYHQVNEKLEAQGVIFTDMDTALREHEDLVREHWATIIPPNDNKLAALNSAVWSGGSFVYVPAGVKVEMPLQAYFRINTENMGQFERTLIICEEGADVHYIEGCTAPVYSSDSLHSAVVEIVAKKSSRVRYTTVQNWSQNVFNLVTKRAVAHEKATMEWVDCNLGSKLTMKYPSIYLLGPEAHGEILSIAFAGEGQHQDAGGKIIHGAPKTSSSIFSKSISKDGGRATYRGLLEVPDDPDRRERRRHRPRGDRLQNRRRAALLPAEPRPRRGGGLEDDRQRVHRAGDQGAADGVRGRAQPADRAADGGLHWLRSRFNRLGFRRGASAAPLSRGSSPSPTRRRRGGNSPTSPGSTSTPTPRAARRRSSPARRARRCCR
jgi:Fe-S cluster assembly protein SufB